MKIPAQVDVFLSKALDCYLAESAKHQLRVEQHNCISAFVDLNHVLHQKTGDKLRQVFAQQSFVPFVNYDETGL